MAAALLVLFALNLFWGSVALSPADMAALARAAGQDVLADKQHFAATAPAPRRHGRSAGAALSVQGICCKLFCQPLLRGRSSWAFPAAKLAVALTMVVFLNRGLLTNSLTFDFGCFRRGCGCHAVLCWLWRAACAAHEHFSHSGVMIGYICSAITDIVVAFAQGFQHRQPAQLV